MPDRRTLRIASLALSGSLVAFLLAGCSSVQTVSMTTRDGGTVFADVYGSGTNGLVLAHGGRFDKSSWAKQAPVFADAGFRVVAIDFRGRGHSEGGPDDPGGENVHLDVLAAVRYLQRTGAREISVVGASFGGWAAAKAAALVPGEIDRIVLLAATVEEPELLTGSKLFILTREDYRGNGILRLPEIREQFERTPEPRRMVLLEGEAHAQFIFETDEAERLMRELLNFLSGG